MQFDVGNLTLESIRDKWADVNDFSTGASIPESPQDVMKKVLDNMENIKKAKGMAAASSSPASGASSSGFKSEKIFNMMSVYLSRGEGKAEVEKVQSIFAF